MATMYGADVAQLRQLAAQFDAKAQALDANRMTVGNAIQISAWVGPVAVRFRHTWESDYSRKLHDAAVRLRDAATKLRANADDQERTSAVDSGAGRGGGGGWSPGNVLPPSDASRWAKIPEGEEFLRKFPPFHFVPMPYPIAGNREGDLGHGITDWMGPDLFNFVAEGPRGGLFPWLQERLDWTPDPDAPLFGSFDAGFFISKIPHLGNIVSGIGLGNVLSDPNATVIDKLWGIGNTAVDVASGALKSVPNPVSYLSGVALAQITDVAEQASKADCSPEQLQTNFDYITKKPLEAAGAAAEAVVDYIPDLIDNLWPW